MADEEINETEAGTEGQPAAEDPNREGVIAALRRERAGYELRDLKGRVAEVDAELTRLGVTKPSASGPRETAVESKPRRTAGRAKQGE